MKRILTMLFSIVVLSSWAQAPVITATVSGKVILAGTNLPVAGHALTFTMYPSNNTGGAITTHLITDENGDYYFIGTIEAMSGVIEIQTVTCNGQSEFVTLQLSYNSPNDFTIDFYVCEITNCQASFTYYETDSLSYQFVNQSIGGEDLNFYWSFGDDTYSVEENPLKTYPSGGEYTVSLYISSPDSTCYNISVQNLIIEGGSCKAYFEAYNSNSNNLMINFNDFSTGNVDMWHWDFGDNTMSNEQNPVHTYAQPGIYPVCLTIYSNDQSCQSNFCESVMVSPSEDCLAQFTWYPDSSSNLYDIQFVDLSYGAISNWQWSFGDGTSSTEQNPFHTYANEGSYQVCLTVYGEECQSAWCFQVDVYNYPIECFNYFTYVNAGNTVEFTGTHSTNLPATYSWDFGDDETATGNSVIHTFDSPGVYFVTLSSWDSNQCFAQSFQNIVVGDSISFNQVYGQVFNGNWPLNNGYVMIISLDSDTNYIPFVQTVEVDSAGVYIFPLIPNGTFKILAVPADGSTAIPTYYESTQFWQDATNVIAGQNTNPLNIQLVNANVMNAGNGNITGQINQSGIRSDFMGYVIVYLTDSQHNIIDFTEVSATGAFSFNNLANGTYYIKPELSGTISDYQKAEITQEQGLVTIEITFSGNSFLGYADRVAADVNVSVYPNPVEEIARIEFIQAKSGEVNASLYDISGRKLMEQSVLIPSGSANIDLSLKTLESGIYIMKLRFADGIEVTRKLIRK